MREQNKKAALQKNKQALANSHGWLLQVKLI
jgi:hypothetical protein